MITNNKNSTLYTISVFLLSIFCFISCKKYETVPLYIADDNQVWDPADSVAVGANYFLNDLYTYLPGGFNRISLDVLDAATDDAIPSRLNTTVQYYTNGRISQLNNPDDVWSNYYYGIRRTNILLKNAYKIPNLQFQTYGKAEARFLRAMFYFELVKRYGGVPLMGDSVYTINDDLRLPRNTFAQCIDYISSECDSVKYSLRSETGSDFADGVWGHAPRGAAYALKSRVLLYAASPLFNGGGIETDAAKKSLTGYPAYDANRWQLALNAADSLISLNYYVLYSAFDKVFTVKKNTEVILSKQAANSYTIETRNAPVGYASPAVSYGYTSPTQELVDAFPMNNGKAITDLTSGYNAAAPYVGRDPRLGYTVFYNGYKWLSRNVETFTGGKDLPGGTTTQTRTGYYMRKFMADFSSNTTYTNQNHNFIIFRYAEILLNRAEALNELGRTSEAYAPLIALRKRAGITAGTNSLYGLKASMTQAEMRAALQNERRIELAFEEHRFWDLRRWKLASTNLTGDIHGVTITKDPQTSALTFNSKTVATLIFSNKLYHMPIPYSEIIKNQNLIQNEGW